MNILEWLDSQGSIYYGGFTEAAKGGHLSVLTYLYEKAKFYPNGITSAAAKGGQLHVLKWATEENIEWDDDTFKCAIDSGNVKMLQWLFDNQKITTTFYLNRSEFPLVYWLIKNQIFNFDTTRQVWLNAARNGHLDTIKIFSDCSEYMSCIYSSAASAGQLHILKWAHENGVPKLEPDKIVEDAAIGGQLLILKWTKEIGIFGPRSIICEAAAKNGDLEMLNWAVQNGCDAKHIADTAAKKGHLNILKWAFTNGEDYCYFLLFKAACKGHTSIVKWLVENYALENLLSDLHICSSVAAKGHLGVLKYLRQKGCHWNSKLICEMNSTPSVAKWLLENSCPCNGSICKFHIKNWTIEGWYAKFFIQ